MPCDIVLPNPILISIFLITSRVNLWERTDYKYRCLSDRDDHSRFSWKVVLTPRTGPFKIEAPSVGSHSLNYSFEDLLIVVQSKAPAVQCPSFMCSCGGSTGYA